MDIEPLESSRERAVSSEPCSTRPNPFDDGEQSSRKRQRVSSSGSRSRSVDGSLSTTEGHMTPGEDSPEIETNPEPPQTPTRTASAMSTTEPTSSKVTINLRSSRAAEPTSSPQSSPVTPTKVLPDTNQEEAVETTEIEEEGGSIATASITSSTSPLAAGSPEIELVAVGDTEYADQSPAVAIIDDGDDDGDEVDEDGLLTDNDPVLDFPYVSPSEPLAATARRVARFLEFDLVDSEEPFCRLRDWIDSYLRLTADQDRLWREAYEKDREFWDTIPNIVSALSRRRSFFGQFLTRSRDGRRALTDFFMQYARLAARFVTMDTMALDQYDIGHDGSGEPISASRSYLSALSFLLRKEETPHIGRNLEAHYQWNWTEDMSLMMNSFLAGGGSIPALTTLVQGQLRFISRNPKVVDDLTDPCRLVAKAVIESSYLPKESAKTAEQLANQGYHFYKVISDGLVPIIEKHVTFLTPDAALAHITCLSQILQVCLNIEECTARELVQEHRNMYPDLPVTYTATVIALEWKFETLKRLIVSGQMQLRVIGVTHMCSELLAIFTRHKKDEPTNHPLLLHFASLILQHKLVDYIVGIGSHPELISQSSNIIGFLIATRTYSTQQTDTIWQTVMTSQDPRVVEAILRMLGEILNLYDFDSLLYLCRKVGELPLEAFTLPMRDYCERILSNLVRIATQDSATIDAPPYDLCVRLIREASISRPEAPMGSLDIQQFALTRLRELIIHGPEAQIRNSIYVSCIKDISARTVTAQGSISAIYGLLNHNLATDLHILCTNHGLTRLMIEEFEYSNSAERNASIPSNANSPARQARRDLLLCIILHEPSTITVELGRRLWNTLVGKDARSHADREIAWQMLNNAAKKVSSKNGFIASCFKEHLPSLPPECYTIGSLDFAHEAVHAFIREAQGDLLDEQQNPGFQSVEQLWRMVLTASPNTIELPAINMLVETYIDSPIIANMVRARAHALHLTVTNRCLHQLSNAAKTLRGFGDSAMSGDDEPMVIVATDEQIQDQELIFTRSLMLLREFLRLYQSKSRHVMPKSRSPIMMVPNGISGDLLDFKYQAFDGDKRTPMEVISLEKSNTIAELIGRLQTSSGFPHCKIYHWGKEINLDEIEPAICVENLHMHMGLILVVRIADDDSDGRLSIRSTSLEAEITSNFDDFWDYLGMEEKLSREIYQFLITFPVYHKLLAAFEDTTTPFTNVFPLGQPYKCLYAVHALREHLGSKLKEGAINDRTLTRALSLVVMAISSEEVLSSCSNDELSSFLAQSLVECLTLIMRQAIPAEALELYLNSALLDRLLQLLRSGQASSSTHSAVQLVSSTFEAILEVSLHSPEIWSALISAPNTPQLLYDLLLGDPRAAIRKSVMKHITIKCTFTPSISSLSTIGFAVAIWPILNDLVPRAVLQPDKAEEILSVTLLIFRKIADTSIESLELESCLLRWGSLLAEHKPDEDIGHPDRIDLVARGLGSLLYWCTSFSKASERPLPPNNIAVMLFTKHLFPDLSDSGDDVSITESVPLLNTATRRLMGDIIVYLTKDDRRQYKQIMEHLEYLLPYHPDDEIPYALELPYGFDRSKSIRSATGYVGLRNLSNTCYLNSLFTQLFMNISFRDFMLKAHVADDASQKLLHETQKLFGFMQNSFRRYVDPSSLALSIRTYDDTNIDVSIQMDVDEFYNLLFDRWEGQILEAADKRRFRSFYGGQLVQQVKSKECPHISERLEPFSAIQCDIKGKTSLQESLQAYVDGEIMEGDNKYKCSSCDRHVNAVKRACLKDIPDNLIFHLKRFDFNLRTMQRSKINDYFSFPHKIDMRPYKVEHLMNSPEDAPEDVFELVGILVHSGTAESGHYYSYIRERPSRGQYPSWVEFNDDHVISFDPALIESNCFGGMDYRGPDSGSFQFDKSWSAYMLFYQRSSVLQAQQEDVMVSGSTQPYKLSIDPAFNNFIVAENETILRKYCLYDEAHAPFVLRMLDNLQHLNQGRCSENHVLEKLALNTTFSHLDQVVARAKDLPDFASYMLTLCHQFQTCHECSEDFLDWLIRCNEAFRQLLFRNPDPTVRGEIVAAILLALGKLKQESAFQYGLYDDVIAIEEDPEGYENPRLFPRLLETLVKFWDSFHLSVRAWPEYFGLLGSMAQLGTHETALMLDHGFLQKVLEVLSANSALTINTQYTRMLAIMQKRPATKPVSLECVISLLEILLKACDLSAEPLFDTDDRLDLALDEEAIPLINAEHHLLVQHWTKGHVNILVEQLLTYNQNERSTQAVIEMMLTGLEDIERSIFNAVRLGIRKSTNNSIVSAAPFLRAALTFCQSTNTLESIESMILHVTNTTRVLDTTEGGEHLRFFKELVDLPISVAEITKDELFCFVIRQIPSWSPSLLTYYDSTVRMETEDYIEQTLLKNKPDTVSAPSDESNSQVILEVVRSLGVACLKYLHDEYVIPRAQAVKAHLLSIQAVIELCKTSYNEVDGDELDTRFAELYHMVVPALKRLTVEEIDEDVSEWENSDDAFSSSEVMDSITELCGAVDGDANEQDARL